MPSSGPFGLRPAEGIQELHALSGVKGRIGIDPAGQRGKAGDARSGQCHRQATCQTGTSLPAIRTAMKIGEKGGSKETTVTQGAAGSGSAKYISR